MSSSSPAKLPLNKYSRTKTAMLTEIPSRMKNVLKSSKNEKEEKGPAVVAPSVTLKDIETPPTSGSETDFLDFLLDAPVKSRFTSGNFLKASQIIRAIKNPHPSPKEDRRPIFWSDEERILTYELTVAILKHSSFLRDALEKSNFYGKFPHLQSSSQEELLVILYDLMEREFRISQEDTPLPESFAKLQTAILSFKTKLMAHIAKLRIKHDATALENLLPTNLRQRQNIDKNPLYIWINLKKAGVSKVVTCLKSQGLKETCFEDDTLIQENLFSVSRLHPDLLRMHSSKTATITSLPIFRDGSIIVQDKSACLPVYVLSKALFFKEAINHRGVGMEHLNPLPHGSGFKSQPVSGGIIVPTGASENDSLSGTPKSDSVASTPPIPGEEPWYHGILDGSSSGGKNSAKFDSVVVTHCGPGRTAAHLAILLSEAVPRYLSKSVNMSTTGTNLEKAIKSKFIYRPPLNVVVFGVPQNKYEEIYKYLKKTLTIQNIRLYSEEFINVSPKDSRIKGCGAILVNPPSSGSALKDPVAYICSEGGDEQILQQYSRYVSTTVMDDENGNPKTTFSPLQSKILSHALAVPNVKLVLYTTCSNLDCENGAVVKTCLSDARRREETRKCQIFASIVMQSQSKQYREVSYEMVNLDQLMAGYDDEEGCFKWGYVNMQPNSACSGVFMSLIRRRDRLVNIAKNPVKQFVASQIRQWTDDEEAIEDYFDQLLSNQTSRNASFSNLSSLKGFTEDELARYLIRKLNLDESNKGKNGRNSIDFSRTPSVVPVFQANMKKKASKKAIVKRVSTPTHSSLQRQKEKYSGGSSSPPSGQQTPRSGGRSPTLIGSSAAGVLVESAPSTSRSAANAGNNTARGRPGTAATGMCPYHHHHGQGHVCICARHAKKHPDMLKSL